MVTKGTLMQLRLRYQPDGENAAACAPSSSASWDWRAPTDAQRPDPNR